MEPKVYRHDIGPIEALGMAGAQAYGRLDSKLINHIQDTTRHINDAERNSWNNKVDKSKYDSEVSAIQSELRRINRVITDYTGILDDKDSFVTKADLMTELQNYVTYSTFDRTSEASAPAFDFTSGVASDVVNEALDSYVSNESFSDHFVYDEEDRSLTIH